MWTLTAQVLDGLDETLNTALTLRDGTPVYVLTPLERAAIHSVYQLYEQMAGQLQTAHLPVALAAARPRLYDAYDQVEIGGRLASFRSSLLASTTSCPYCGFGELKDLDHYLPRSIFGELAIYPNNLIPSCGPCNNAKRKIVPGQGTGMIHPYFQILPEVDFFKADVSFNAGALNVTYRIDPAGLAPALVAQLQFQLDRLKLNQRYVAQINKFISEQKVAMLMFSEQGAAIFSDFLLRGANSMARSFHRNDWRVALFRSLSDNADFCADPASYLSNGTSAVADSLQETDGGASWTS